MKTNFSSLQLAPQQEEYKKLLSENKKELQTQYRSAIAETSASLAQEAKSIQKIKELSQQLHTPAADTFVKSQTKKSANALSKILTTIKKR